MTDRQLIKWHKKPLIKRSNTFINTGAICLVTAPDENVYGGLRQVDLGNYFIDQNGNRCLITSKEMAYRYAELVDVPVYVMHEIKD